MKDAGFGGAGATARWDAPTSERLLALVRDASVLPLDDRTPTLGSVTASGLVAPIHSLEQPWRSNAVGISCIPEGLYRLVLAQSFRFHREMPRLLGVPGREGILIHGGNSTADTEGCILVGRERTADGRSILRSREALGLVVAWLGRAAATGPVWIRVSRAALPAAA